MRRPAMSLALLMLAPLAAAAEPPRTVPDPACAPSYLGTSGVIGMPADPGLGTAAEGGEIAPPDVAAALPDTIAFRSMTETFNRRTEFALLDGDVWARAIGSTDWRSVGLPWCLDGNVSAISADGDSLVATDADGWLYTVSLEKASPGGLGWTRRWGPFFWFDLGMRIPDDVLTWSTSDLSSGEDGTFTDRAGNQHAPFGILNLYLLRGDGRTITTLDPWLPSDDSREVCTPGRSTTQIAGLNGSGSHVVIVDREGAVWSRLYEFDVAGSNTVFYDYAWEDQTGVASPRVQLPAPDWVEHPPVPGVITDRVSMHKTFPAPTGRVIRAEGMLAGDTGYWEANIAGGAWTFVATGEPLLGRPLPLPMLAPLVTEDVDYTGTVEGMNAEIIGFNPYCSPATLRVHPDGGDPFDLVLHSIDGLRQERRARGLDADPRGYRSAIEVPQTLWDARASLPFEAHAFIERWFTDSLFLDGPLVATRSSLRIGVPCWLFARADVPDAPFASSAYDLGAQFAGLMAAQEEDRSPSACTAPYGAP